MGLMDKVKAQATQLAQKTPRKQLKKVRPSLIRRRRIVAAMLFLRQLGAAVFAERTGRGTPKTARPRLTS